MYYLTYSRFLSHFQYNSSLNGTSFSPASVATAVLLQTTTTFHGCPFYRVPWVRCLYRFENLHKPQHHATSFVFVEVKSAFYVYALNFTLSIFEAAHQSGNKIFVVLYGIVFSKPSSSTDPWTHFLFLCAVTYLWVLLFCVTYCSWKYSVLWFAETSVYHAQL